MTLEETTALRKWAIVHYDYNPITGVFTNRISGHPVTTLHDKGYVLLKLRKKKFFAHRVAYLIMEGQWPVQIDHRNRIRSDNRWENLLSSTQALNAQNHGLRRTCKSGHTGVSWTEKYKWEACLMRNGKRRKKRGIATKEEAIAVRADLEASFDRGEWV